MTGKAQSTMDEPKFTAEQIARACGGEVAVGRPDAAAGAVCTDTRELTAGQAFLALVGPNHDAHRFVPQAVGAGASIVIAHTTPPGWIDGAGTALATAVAPTMRRNSRLLMVWALLRQGSPSQGLRANQ